MKVVVVGFGRFGRLWSTLLREDFDVTIVENDVRTVERAEQEGFKVTSVREAFGEATVVFYAVPISSFEAVLREHVQFFSGKTAPLLIDLLSVKVHPQQIFKAVLPPHVRSMLCHPMFGPESVRVQGLADLKIVFTQNTATDAEFSFWCDYAVQKKLAVTTMSAEEHDQLAAKSQGVVHFVGRILGEIKFEPTSIDTLGAKKLFEIKHQVCNDSIQLFKDLQTMNPYTVEMRAELGAAQEKMYDALLPNRINTSKIVVGIQGGSGSFNEVAAHYYLERSGEINPEVKYLYTTEKVLNALHEGKVDRGQFAIHNSTGGIVHESIEAMSHFRFHIVEEFSIKISHSLMIRKDVELKDVDTIVAHPQVFRQCTRTLMEKYPRLKTTSGEGDAIDSATAASLIANGTLPKTCASMGNRLIADIYGLKVVEDNLQDNDQNYTSFLWVERPRSV